MHSATMAHAFLAFNHEQPRGSVRASQERECGKMVSSVGDDSVNRQEGGGHPLVLDYTSVGAANNMEPHNL